MEFLIGCGSSVAAETGNSILAKIKRHVGYIFHYNRNIVSLKVAQINLDAKINDANRFTDDTNRMLKDVSSIVTHWRSEAEKLHREARKRIISADKRSPTCLNPLSRYSSSKNACELAQQINEKVQNAPDFGTTFDRPAPKVGAKFDLSGFTEFESRVSVVNAVWEALKDEKVRMCSICGMGGVGKTTLAKKLIQRVERDHLFDKVAMVTVSQNPDPRKIRGDIISSLGLKCENEELIDNFTSNIDTSILLIFDDVWEELDFEAIGLLRIKAARIKIVLTSRKVDVCQRMGSEPNFVINVLTDEEARSLFKEIATGTIDKWKLHDVARKIADECGGLPIVIVTLATALKYEVKATWNDSLLKLQKSNLLGISGMEKVYSRIQLSYDLLKDKEAQLCFRLCCLFPEDHDVPVERLVFYGKGLELFESVESLSEARDRVESIVHKLKKSFLLLDSKKHGCVTMHDILRDFAISISSKDKHPYIAGSEKVMKKWPETNMYENCSAISFVCDTIDEHPVDLKCPKLELLQLRFHEGSTSELPIGIFEGLKELKVLDLQVPSLLQPLTTLKKLRTLLIDEKSYDWGKKEPQKIGDLLGRGDLKNLEILAFSSKRKISCGDFPEEIGLLCNLRCLRFGEVEHFKYMPQGVLSKLVKLEELELPFKFISWGCKEEGGERVNASLNEIESLPLTTLRISVPIGPGLADKLVNNLTRFWMFIGSYYGTHMFRSDLNASLLVFRMDASDVTVPWIRGLMTKCERLRLEKVRNLKSITCLQSGEEHVFPQLKQIYIDECRETEYLVDTIAERINPSFRLEKLMLWDMDSLKEIWHFSRIESYNLVPCFSNLSAIKIVRRPKLKHLFPLSVARELRQLKSIFMKDCRNMEKIFYRDEADDGNQITEENITVVDEKEVDRATMIDAIIFPKLETLILLYLNELRVFYDGYHAIELPSLEESMILECSNMKTLSYGPCKAPRLQKREQERFLMQL